MVQVLPPNTPGQASNRLPRRAFILPRFPPAAPGSRWCAGAHGGAPAAGPSPLHRPPGVPGCAALLAQGSARPAWCQSYSPLLGFIFSLYSSRRKSTFPTRSRRTNHHRAESTKAAGTPPASCWRCKNGDPLRKSLRLRTSGGGLFMKWLRAYVFCRL